ncbi:MAG TPA: nuclear transport factor 2 family protein [Candidatus Dormibacteraeota bacterium]|jgi:ketosteroid isomerase-like protein
MTQITSVVERLALAVNAHDLEAMAECFAADFVNETPLHPARNFNGRAQVRRNWGAIFAGVPDIRAQVLRSVADADTAWVEWEMSGNRAQGGAHLMRGVTVMGIAADQIRWIRFYLEPVEEGGVGVDAAVQQAVGR